MKKVTQMPIGLGLLHMEQEIANDALLIEMLQHAYEYGLSAYMIGQIAKLHMAGYSPAAIISRMEKFSGELADSYPALFREKFAA